MPLINIEDCFLRMCPSRNISLLPQWHALIDRTGQFLDTTITYVQFHIKNSLSHCFFMGRETGPTAAVLRPSRWHLRSMKTLNCLKTTIFRNLNATSIAIFCLLESHSSFSLSSILPILCLLFHFLSLCNPCVVVAFPLAWGEMIF